MDSIFTDFGLFGMFISAFMAATILPFSSDLVFFALLYSPLNPFALIFWASLGNILGAFTGYYLGWLGKWEWIEKYLGIKRSMVLNWQKTIDKWAFGVAFFTWLPFIGDLLTVALGYFKVNWKPTLLGVVIGKSFRYIMIYLFKEKLVNYFLS